MDWPNFCRSLSGLVVLVVSRVSTGFISILREPARRSRDSSTLGLPGTCNRFPGRGYDGIGCEAELLLQVFERRRGAEGVHADHDAGRSNVVGPSEDRGLFNGDARRYFRRQHLFFVVVRLVVEDFPRRHTDDAGLDALGGKLLIST